MIESQCYKKVQMKTLLKLVFMRWIFAAVIDKIDKYGYTLVKFCYLYCSTALCIDLKS